MHDKTLIQDSEFPHKRLAIIDEEWHYSIGHHSYMCVYAFDK